LKFLVSGSTRLLHFDTHADHSRLPSRIRRAHRWRTEEPETL